MPRQSNGMLNPTLHVTKLVDGTHKNLSISYRGIRALRRDTLQQLKESVDGEIHIARSRRGKWGEWFEVWALQDGKPSLLREGWQ